MVKGGKLKVYVPIQQSTLKPEELEYLKAHFRYTSSAANEFESINASQLTNNDYLLALLEQLTVRFKSPNKMVTASQFSKKYGYLVLIPALYSMTIYNKGLDPSLPNLSIEWNNQDALSLPCLRLAKESVSIPFGDRGQWREAMVQSIFRENLSNVLRSFSQAASLPLSILWENVAVYVYWLYEKRIKENASEQEKTRIFSDFYYLIHEADGDVFGETENPLKKYYVEMCDKPFSAEPIRIRRTCCFYYALAPNGECCLTCPKGKREIEQIV
jgi:ferric iron reductase protein FhuF